MDVAPPFLPVRVKRQAIDIPTYDLLPPDPNPMFLEKRVYQGSSGKVYPLPVYDRVSNQRTCRQWDAIWIENEFLEVMLLPEIGGRIHAAKDKTNGYDLFYRQEVIKPALVGLAGPWISGGVEFNWPQHHRPATYMPTAVEIERHSDGSVTVWCSDHDPMTRMKGMHGVCLHPGKAMIELKVRVYNRTPMVQTFLWWANVATRVHNAYQSFFPPDVSYVADHARRSMSTYPLCHGLYYGVDYESRAMSGTPPQDVPALYVPPNCGGSAPVDYAANDLSFYANIPVPTSYMCMGSSEDFFGGYDYYAKAGVVHVANHHIAPGKKQWTWGNHEFGYAWDHNLTDATADGEFPPYIEIMAGVYTDNQPDFSFLMPWETKTWSQFWYPIQEIGPAEHANIDAAISLHTDGRSARLGVCVTKRFARASIELLSAGEVVGKAERDLMPGTPQTVPFPRPGGLDSDTLGIRITDHNGCEIISYHRKPRQKAEVPPSATEPPAPQDIATIDELYLTGLHLEQYRHATRDPAPYWREALKRDLGDSRSHNALGLWHLRRGEFERAKEHFDAAIRRLQQRNANPRDGEAFYNLGLALRRLGRDDEAYAAFYKATWNQQWQASAYHALAEIDCRNCRWSQALDHLDRALRANADDTNARNLRAIVLRKLGNTAAATAELQQIRSLDILDWWSRHLSGETISADTQVFLDIALDFARAGFDAAAISLLESAKPETAPGTAPLVHYYLAWFHGRLRNDERALHHCKMAASAAPDYCFPSRLEEIEILTDAIKRNPADARARYYLGNLFYDRKRHTDAVELWTEAAELDSSFSIVWRNLGIARFNNMNDKKGARAAYDRAIKAAPSDARLIYERDQLWKQLRIGPQERLGQIEPHLSLALQRDDMAVELCALYNQMGRHADALEILLDRHFQPWEGGEGQALSQYIRARLALGRKALAKGDVGAALQHFKAPLSPPRNLSEANHLLANRSDVHYWLGIALHASGDVEAAASHWRIAAEFVGDFQAMAQCPFSEMTYYSARSKRRLGDEANADALCRSLLEYARHLATTQAKIDYFATSLPTMLLFEDDIQYRLETTALFLEGQAHLGLGEQSVARDKLAGVLARDPNHPYAEDLLRQIDRVDSTMECAQ